MIVEAKLCLFDRRTLPKTDSSYYAMVANHTFERKGLRITLEDGRFFTAITVPAETEDRDGAMFVTASMKDELSDALAAGTVKVVNLAYIPVPDAEAAL